MNRRQQKYGAALVAGMLVATAATGADAQTLVGLTGDQTLVIIDAAQPRVTSRVVVSGISAPLVGIDVRPADGMLYGLVRDGTVVVIDPGNGSVAVRSQLSQTLRRGVQGNIDFNPVPDRLRIIGADGTNLRANVDTGAVIQDTPLAFAQPNPFGGVTPRVIAHAYSNNVAGAKATILWDIDDGTDSLYVQIPPNDGVLNAVANPLGIPISGAAAFDIETLPDGTNRAWLVSGSNLYQVGLVSGLALNPRPVEGLRGRLRDLAVLPASS
jgi:hypothetical protein